MSLILQKRHFGMYTAKLTLGSRTATRVPDTASTAVPVLPRSTVKCNRCAIEAGPDTATRR